VKLRLRYLRCSRTATVPAPAGECKRAAKGRTRDPDCSVCRPRIASRQLVTTSPSPPPQSGTAEFQVAEFQVAEFQVALFHVAEFQVALFQVAEFQVALFHVAEFQVALFHVAES
jgi:hypothetical protein